MAEWILVLVILPGHVVPGREYHTPFTDKAACEKALTDVHLPNWDHWKYCVPKDGETWTYKMVKSNV